MSKRKQIYRIAAERMFLRANTLSCVALEEAHVVHAEDLDSRTTITDVCPAAQEEINFYGSTFSPSFQRVLFWLSQDDTTWESMEEKRDWRITALCFAAVMSRDEMADITPVVNG